MAVASTVWRGATTRWPAVSNQSAKGRTVDMVSALPDLGWIVMVRWYCGMFFLVDVAIVTLLI